MNTIIVSQPPDGVCEEVGIQDDQWQARFLGLVTQRLPIKLNLSTMPTIPDTISQELTRQNYLKCILETDNWQIFLVPQ